MILFRPAPKSAPITQIFGVNPQDYPSTNGHNGIDYGVPEGSPIVATTAGTIVRAELDNETARNSHAGYGIHVRILHPNNVLSIYGHLSGTLVKTGQLVGMGEQIGVSGNTGRSTGPHLHFEVRTGLALLNAIDPAPFLVDDLPNEIVLYTLEITKQGNGLNVRTGPSKERGIIRSLKTGDLVKVYQEIDTGWLRIDDGYILNNPPWEKRIGVPNPIKKEGEEEDIPKSYTVAITADGNGLRVRSGPGTDKAIVRLLKTGERVEILPDPALQGWLRIADGYIFFNPSWIQTV